MKGMSVLLNLQFSVRRLKRTTWYLCAFATLCSCFYFAQKHGVRLGLMPAIALGGAVALLAVVPWYGLVALYLNALRQAQGPCDPCGGWGTLNRRKCEACDGTGKDWA